MFLIAATSNFFMVIMASKVRLASSPPDEERIDLSLHAFPLCRHFRTPCGGWLRCFRRAARALLLFLRFDDHRVLRVRIETQLCEVHRIRDQRVIR